MRMWKLHMSDASTLMTAPELSNSSKAALKRCQAAEKKVRACARAAKLAAGDARHIEGLVRDARRRAPPPAVTSRCK